MSIKEDLKSFPTLENDYGPKNMEVKFFDYLNNLSKSISTLKGRQNSEPIEEKSLLTDKQPKNQNQSLSAQSTASKKNHCRMSARHSERSTTQSFRIISAERNQNQEICGEAHLQYHDGSRFIGKFQNGQRKNGKVIFPSGLQYCGGFKKDTYHGACTIILTNGTTIQTEWNEGCVEPRGKIKYDNGDVYVGSMLNFKKDGFGELKINNKNKKYVGEFENGQITGWGILFENKKPIYEGQWKKGEFIKEGKKDEDFRGQFSDKTD